jgi:hypothetical protein
MFPVHEIRTDFSETKSTYDLRKGVLIGTFEAVMLDVRVRG